MADSEQDPFSWDTDRLVQELCVYNRTWSSSSVLKLPKPAELEATIREHELDGQAFLTYGDVFGIMEFWKSLNVRKIPHQLSLNTILGQLRQSSRRYKTWKKEQHVGSHQSESEDTDDDTPAQTKSENPHSPPADTPSQPTNMRSPPPEIAASLQAPSSEKPKKRAAPSLVETNPGFSRGFKVLETHDQGITDADLQASIMANTQDGASLAQDDDSLQAFLSTHLDTPTKAYLGGPLKKRKIIEPSEADEDEVADFSWVGPHALPSGRRFQVASCMKKLLLGIPDRDEEQSDDDEEYLETLKEFEQDRKECEAEKKKLERRAAKQDKALSPQEILNKVIKELERGWALKKNGKYKHDCGARALWSKACRTGDRVARIQWARNLEAKMDQQSIKLQAELLSDVWSDEADWEKFARDSLSATIEERELARWTIRTFESLEPPPKRKALVEPAAMAPRIRKQAGDDDDDSDGQTLSDESDYFSEGSDLEHLPELDPMQLDCGRESESESAPMEIDSLDDPLVLESPGSDMASESASPSIPDIVVKSEKQPLIDIPGRPSSPIVILEDEATPDLHDAAKIQEMGADYWQTVGDYERLTIAVFFAWPQDRHDMVAAAIQNNSVSELWNRHIASYFKLSDQDVFGLGRDTVDFALVRLFDCYIGKAANRCREDRWATAPLRRITFQRIASQEEKFAAFYDLLRGVLDAVKASTPIPPILAATTPEPHRGSPLEPFSSIQRGPAEEADVEQMLRVAFEGSDSEQPAEASGRRGRQRNREDVDEAKRLIKKSQNQGKEFKERALNLQLQLQSQAEQQPSSVDRSRLVVNLSKDADDGLIYINDHIGAKIRDHQIEGVRFMWNNVVKSSLGQGCLLAHEMGLGKTMQAITLLTVIAAASASKDETVSRQVPPRLQGSRTLVLCPAGLVENWVEEFGRWSPDGLLGPTFKLDAAQNERCRVDVVKQWSEQGGILICGYDIFAVMSGMRAGKHQYEKTAEIMRCNANIVIGDEAHYLKNTKAQRSVAVSNVQTTSRIALTGSPLTKFVTNYYSLIDWVAPGYLGDISGFNKRFEVPIKTGLFADSSAWERRKARSRLAVLKALVEPIVHRNDAKVLHATLPGKKEFIIGLKLTQTQFKAYSAYIKSIKSVTGAEQFTHMVKVWSLVTYLSALVGHPVIFKKKLEEKKQAASNKNMTGKKKPKKTAEGEEEAEDVELSNDLLSDLLAHVNDRTIEDIVHSNKMRILFRILDESKRIKDKVLIFSQSLKALDYLENVFTKQQRNFSRMDGSTKATVRQKQVQDFNEDPNAEIYLISTTAGCIGLNIVGANRVVIFDFKYTPAEEQQAIGRAYRIGQQKMVYVYWLLSSGTFEQTLHEGAIFKKQLAQRVVDKQNPDPKASKLKDYFKEPQLVNGQDLSPFRGQDRILDALIDEFPSELTSITPTETYETEEVFEFNEDDHLDIQTNLQEFQQQAAAPGPHVGNQHNGAPLGFGSLGPARRPPPRMGTFHPAPTSTQPAPTGHPTRSDGPGPSAQSGSNGHSVPQTAPGPNTPRPVQARQGAPARPRALASGFSASPSPPEDQFVAPPATDPFVAPPAAGSGVPEFSPFLRPSDRLATGSGAVGTDAAAPTPILAAGTHVMPLDPPTPKPVGTTDEDLYKALGKVFTSLSVEGYRELVEPRDIVKAISEILKKFGHGAGLPKMEKLQSLHKHLVKQRVSEALLLGFLTPETVVGALESGGLDRMVQNIIDMERPDLIATVRNGKKARDSRNSTEIRPRGRPRRPPPLPRLETRTPTSPLPPRSSIDLPPPEKRAAAAAGRNGQAQASMAPTPQARRQSLRPGDTAESPHIIE